MMTLNEIKKQINKENKDYLTKRIENLIKKILENIKQE
jgi:sporulation-control protein spo0M